MGCSCHVKLPQNVRIADVADVCGILLGLEKYRWGENDKYHAVRFISFDKKSDMPSFVRIVFQGAKFDTPTHQVNFDYETDGDHFSLSTTSTPIHIAMSKRLVEFFGGVVDANDCDDNDIEDDFVVKFKSRKVNSPGDGKDWQDLQDRIWNVKPLTKAEIQKCEKLAAYGAGVE